jgi:hypothetical protein
VKERKGEGSGIPFGKEMEDSIDIRGVADVTHFHVEVDESFQVVHLDQKSGSIWKMIDQGVDFAQIKGIGKNFFHVRKISEVINI